jgi:hypothetical protein
MAEDAERSDLLHAWLDALGQLRSAAGTLTDPPDAVHRLQELQEELVRRSFLPVDALLAVSAQLVEPLREQAEAFERASKAFAEVGVLLRQQAELLEAAAGAVRAPTEALKALTGASAPKRKAKPQTKARKAPAKRRAPRKR